MYRWAVVQDEWEQHAIRDVNIVLALDLRQILDICSHRRLLWWLRRHPRPPTLHCQESGSVLKLMCYTTCLYDIFAFAHYNQTQTKTKQNLTRYCLEINRID